jgi:hypothetical protein
MTKISLSASFSHTADLLTFQIIFGTQAGASFYNLFNECGRKIIAFVPQLSPVEQDLFFNFINE